jgi:hypothetical protein
LAPPPPPPRVEHRLSITIPLALDKARPLRLLHEPVRQITCECHSAPLPATKSVRNPWLAPLHLIRIRFQTFVPIKQ